MNVKAKEVLPRERISWGEIIQRNLRRVQEGVPLPALLGYPYLDKTSFNRWRIETRAGRRSQTADRSVRKRNAG